MSPVPCVPVHECVVLPWPQRAFARTYVGVKKALTVCARELIPENSTSLLEKWADFIMQVWRPGTNPGHFVHSFIFKDLKKKKLAVSRI